MWLNIMKQIIFLGLILIIVVTGCTTNTEVSNKGIDNIPDNASSSVNINSDVEKVEVLHFHATQQCYSCKTVGKYTEDTVNTYFANELNEGKITFASINIDLVENAKLVSTYKPTGSSLWIGVYDKNGLHKEENTNVWYKIDDREAFMFYLKGVLDKRLQGDLS